MQAYVQWDKLGKEVNLLRGSIKLVGKNGISIKKKIRGYQ